MIASGLKKLAEENGMTVAHGVAYGNLGGFSATFSEGAGWKRIDFATRFLDEEKKQGFISEVNKVNLVKTYRVQRRVWASGCSRLSSRIRRAPWIRSGNFFPGSCLC